MLLDRQNTLYLSYAIVIFMSYYIIHVFFTHSTFDPRVRDALAVYTDDWLIIQRK